MIALACDLGGTRIKLGVVRDARVLAHTVEPANSKAGLKPQLPVLRAVWLRLLADLNLTLADCAGITLSFPSLVDPRTATVLAQYGKFDDATGFDFRAWARAEFGLPLAMENDARMALVGEWQVGAGRGCDDLAMITLGTGLGTCAIMQGRLLRGRHGQAGVLGGHVTVRYGGRLCVCGNVGCAEAEASTACLREVIAASPQCRNSAFAAGERLDYADIFRAAAQGDPCATALRDHSLSVWGAMAVNLIHAYDCELLILGGGIMGSAEVILPAISEYVWRHAKTPWGRVRIVPSTLGDHAALVAADWFLAEHFALEKAL